MQSIGPNTRRKSLHIVKHSIKSIRQKSTSVTSVGLMLIEIDGMPICEREGRKPSLTNQKRFDTILLR